jgi:hypothetical protein
MKKFHLSILAIAFLFTTLASAGAAVVIVPVPEPGTTLGLLAVGLVAVVGLRRKLGR